MSEAEITTEAIASPPKAALHSAGTWFGWLESDLAKLSDRLNPILIKEARQALKSRQFTVTFILVLAACWCWSIIGIAWIGPGIYWSSEGPSMFYGYFLILAFPLLVIVPYGAFQSLAAEREDRTFELLSITTLRPRQIVAGKLAGATLQMVVYLSAISPCLAFTYLLRGLDIITIGSILLYLIMGSLGLSMLGLLLATATTEKYQQVVLSVGSVLGLVYSFFGACVIAGEMLSWNSGFNGEEFWIFHAILLTAYLSYFALCFLAAAAMLSFVGSNCSTALRVVMVIQQALFMGWMTAGWMFDNFDGDALCIAAVFSGLHWYVMGVFMTGEPGQLSPRVMRDLPQSFLGRAFLTWFNPGPATGYAFAVSSYLGTILLLLAALAIPLGHAISNTERDQVIMVCVLGLSYVALFLGLGRVLLGWLAAYLQVTPAIRVLVHTLLLFVGTIVPLTIQMSLPVLRHEGYTLLQLTNPFWTMAEAIDHSPTHAVWTVSLILGAAALAVFMFSLPAIADEVRQVRIAVPSRVAEEVAELATAAPQVHVKTNPWDD